MFQLRQVVFVQNTYCLRSSPWEMHAIGINVIGNWQRAGLFMFSKSELFSQVFFKDVGLRYRKFIAQNRTLQINYFETLLSRDVLNLLVFLSYWDSCALPERSFLNMFTSQNTISYCFFAHSYSRWLCSLYEDLISSNIIVNVGWQNYLVTCMSDYMQPLISKCKHTLEINLSL